MYSENRENEEVKKQHQKKTKCEIYRDSMQNYKKYAIPPAQLIIADVPYNVGNNFYGSNPMWYKGGDSKNGESKFAGKAAFNSDFNFNLYEYFHFCSKMLKKEDTKPVQRGRSSNAEKRMAVRNGRRFLHNNIEVGKQWRIVWTG